MKNQLRKATLRAAALTMSATIAATSVPMTAFAEEGNDGNDDNQKKQESENQTDEANVKSDEEAATDAIIKADDAVDKIVPERNLVTEDAYEGIVNSGKATEKAKGDEEKVTSDVNALVNSGTTKVKLENDTENLESIVSAAEGIVTKDANSLKKVNEELADAQKEIDKQTNKEDAEEIYNKALSKENAAKEAHDTAVTDLVDLQNKYNEAKQDLENKYGAYKKLVDAGVTDLEAVKADLKAAQENLTKLEGEVKKLEGTVKEKEDEYNAASKEHAESAVKKLADNYNADDADKEAVFKEIVGSYYIKSFAEDATDIEVGDYDSVNKLYPVTYKSNNKDEIVYVSYEYTENGIVITKIDKNKVKDAVEEHYTYKKADGTSVDITVTEYNEYDDKNQILTDKEGNKRLINGLDYDVKVKVGEDDVTEIKNEQTVITADGIVQVTGDVTTVTKTTKSLDVSTKTYATKEEAEKEKNALIAQYEGEGYKVSVENTSTEAKTTWSATAVFVEEKSFTRTVEDKSTDYYTKDELIDGKSKVVLDTSYTTNYETYQKWVGWHIENWRIVDEYEERTREISKTWTVGYADVSSKEVNYSAWNQVEDWWSQLWGGEADKKKAIIEKEANTIKANGGYVLNDDFESWNWNWSTANLYYVNGRTVKVEGYSSADEATAALNQKLADENIVAKDGEIKKDTTNYVEEAAKYSYKLTCTKEVENSSTAKNVLIKESTDEAAIVKHVEAADAVFSYTPETNGYENNFLKEAKETEGKLDSDKTTLDNLKTNVGKYRTQVDAAKDAVEKAQSKATTLKNNLESLQADAAIIRTNIDTADGKMKKVVLGTYDTKDNVKAVEDSYNKLPNRPSNNGGNNNGGGSSNNNNNNQPGLPTLPAGPIATTNTTPTQQVVTLVDDQTPLSATADDTVAPKTNKKAAKKNATKTTDSDSKKTNKNTAKKQPKKVTPEVEDDTIDEDLEIVSLDDEDKVPLAPGVASNDSTKDIMDETSSVSWLWLIILAVASVVTFGTYKGVKKHNENKGKNNR